MFVFGRKKEFVQGNINCGKRNVVAYRNIGGERGNFEIDLRSYENQRSLYNNIIMLETEKTPFIQDLCHHTGRNFLIKAYIPCKKYSLKPLRKKSTKEQYRFSHRGSCKGIVAS